MAVQQNKKSRSARDMRRSHDALTASTLSVEENAPVKSACATTYRQKAYTVAVK